MHSMACLVGLDIRRILYPAMDLTLQRLDGQALYLDRQKVI